MVTRPARQAEGITRKIEQHAGRVIRFPVIEILPPKDRHRLQSVLRRLPRFDWLVFISANAAAMGLRAVEAAHHTQPRAKVATIGGSTARELQARGWRVDVTAKPPFTSEALLREPALRRVRRQRILIFRGEGGRELLCQTLVERGAQVEYAECYRRTPAPSDPELLRSAWSRGRDDVAIMLTSVEGLNNLIQIVGPGDADCLYRTPVVAAGERVASAAREQGWRATVITADDAGDDAMLASLRAWRVGAETSD